ncbi:MAG: type IVB secretion system protein IcmH/DotU [Gammaproteobacteria bacterium]
MALNFYDRLSRFLTVLAQAPGMEWVDEYAVKVRALAFKKADIEFQITDAIEDSVEAKDAGMDLLGMGGDDDDQGGDDRTRIRRPGAPAAEMPEGADRTVIRPRPGARGAAAPAPAARRAAPSAPLVDRGQAVEPRGSGLNPLVDAATALFSLARQLHNTTRHPDPGALRTQMARGIARFDAAAREGGATPESAVTARYALCTMLDEVVLTTPWGAESQWSRHSLLAEFHKETWGGEKFFAALERTLREPARHLNLIEFMYLCMMLGLEGKYRVVDRGRDQLAAIQEHTYRAIRGVRGEYETELSPHWRGVEERRKLRHPIPLWSVAALTGVLMLAAYIGFSYGLAQIAEPPYVELSKIGRDARLTAVVKAVPRTLTLRELLAADIKAGLVDVIEQTQGSTVEIRGDGFFNSGSAEVQSQVIPVLERIGDAMNQFEEPILVAGHTDNVPLSGARRMRFPTNWHLSQARAEAVAAVVGSRLKKAERIRAEGRSDTEPKAPNDTPEGRAQNRRVDVTLLNASR